MKCIRGGGDRLVSDMNIAVLDSLCVNMSWVNSEQALKDHTKCVSRNPN